mmetsp:Transcript_27649/g.85998  ORF Transcript_27649/g.85998 Transcript_27649/m.85998 type:complete len:229 (+) Transcript_27649:3-689(+)
MTRECGARTHISLYELLFQFDDAAVPRSVLDPDVAEFRPGTIEQGIERGDVASATQQPCNATTDEALLEGATTGEGTYGLERHIQDPPQALTTVTSSSTLVRPPPLRMKPDSFIAPDVPSTARPSTPTTSHDAPLEDTDILYDLFDEMAISNALQLEQLPVACCHRSHAAERLLRKEMPDPLLVYMRCHDCGACLNSASADGKASATVWRCACGVRCSACLPASSIYL